MTERNQTRHRGGRCWVKEMVSFSITTELVEYKSEDLNVLLLNSLNPLTTNNLLNFVDRPKSIYIQKIPLNMM